MNSAARVFGVGACFVAIGACDNREAFHRPDPTLARMLEQRRANPYTASGVFADGKTMRDPIADTVAREDGTPESPPPFTRALALRGRARFEVVCAVCHGMAGDGASVVAQKMRSRPPPSLHEERIRALAPRAVFAVITQGYGWMPSYAAMLDANERWAVVAYVEALQLSRHAAVADLPQSMRDELAKEAP